MAKILEIDGSFGEGGGSIIRLAISYSFLYNQPIKIINIRSKRTRPGLRLQHLLGLETLTKLTNSKLSRCEVGTEEFTFIPSGTFTRNDATVQIATAASLGLLLQPIQIASLSLKPLETLTIHLNGGGIFGKWAPSLNYLKDVTFRYYKRAGLKIESDIDRYGFYPRGGAKVTCKLSKLTQYISPIRLIKLGNIDHVKGKIVISSKLMNRNRIIQRIKNTIKNQLKEQNLDLQIQHEWVESYDPGLGLHLYSNSDTGAIISTGTILGERKISSEKLGLIASKKILKYIKNDIPVDNYLSDQLIPLMSISKGASRIKVLEVTNHAKTNLELLKKFNNRDFSIHKEKRGYSIHYF